MPGKDREGILRALEAHVMKGVPVIPLWHDEVLHLVSTSWTGWRISPINRLDLRQVRRRNPQP